MVLTAIMVVILCVLRIAAYHVEGHDDAIITQALTAALTLFTGSFVVARAVSNSNGNGKSEKK